ncbi:MAG: LysE family transporter [Bacteroidetes bacterium]|nr:LysE family transporter [Bacteroidota bacterium]
MFWLMPLIKGVGQGVLISLLSFGPAFFTLIYSGITGGKKHGMRVALGIFLSELTMAFVCFMGLSRIFTYPEFQLGFSFVAAVSIIFIGVKGFSKKYTDFLESIQVHATGKESFLKGFLLNLANPFVLFLWVGLLAAVSVSYEQEDVNYKVSILINLIAILLTLFAMDLGKVFLSDFLGRKLSNKVYFYVNKYFGLIMLLLGAYFFYHFIILLLKYFHIGNF